MGVACSGLWAPYVYVYFFQQNVSVSRRFSRYLLSIIIFFGRGGGGEGGNDDRLHKS